jgi:hypothetical protein
VDQIRISRRRATSRRATRDVEQSFPVPAAELSVSPDEVTALLAHIDSALADD